MAGEWRNAKGDQRRWDKVPLDDEGKEAFLEKEREWCWDKKKKGYTLLQIAAMSEGELGYTLGKGTINIRIKEAVGKRDPDAPLRVFREQEERMESLFVTLRERMRVAYDRGDDKTILAYADRIIRLGESVRKLYGVDAPESVNMNVALGLDPELKAALDKVKERDYQENHALGNTDVVRSDVTGESWEDLSSEAEGDDDDDVF